MLGRPKIRISKTKLGQRIVEAREEKGLTPKQLANLARVSVTSIYGYEAGDNVPRSNVLDRIADALDKPTEWLLARSPLIKDVSGYVPEDIPLVGRGGAGRGEFSEDGFPVGQGWRKITRPYDVKDPNAFAVEVVGDSMTPVFKNRNIVVCSPAREWFSGDYCVVKTEDGEYMIKRVHKSDAQLTLISENPRYEPISVPLKKIKGVFKIVWQKWM